MPPSVLLHVYAAGMPDCGGRAERAASEIRKSRRAIPRRHHAGSVLPEHEAAVDALGGGSPPVGPRARNSPPIGLAAAVVGVTSRRIYLAAEGVDFVLRFLESGSMLGRAEAARFRHGRGYLQEAVPRPDGWLGA